MKIEQLFENSDRLVVSGPGSYYLITDVDRNITNDQYFQLLDASFTENRRDVYRVMYRVPQHVIDETPIYLDTIPHLTWSQFVDEINSLFYDDDFND